MQALQQLLKKQCLEKAGVVLGFPFVNPLLALLKIYYGSVYYTGPA